MLIAETKTRHHNMIYNVPQVLVKLCGLSSRDSVVSAVQNGADYIGCNFDPSSLNCVSPFTAREMVADLPLIGIKKVAVVNRASNMLLSNIISLFAPDLIQFDGSESPDILKIIKSQFNCTIIKTFFVQNAYDLEQSIVYEDIADMFLFHTRSQFGEFNDWNLFKKVQTTKPWMLSGDISRYNFYYILRATNVKVLNITTGIENVPGKQDPVLIKSTVDAIHHYF